MNRIFAIPAEWFLGAIVLMGVAASCVIVVRQESELKADIRKAEQKYLDDVCTVEEVPFEDSCRAMIRNSDRIAVMPDPHIVPGSVFAQVKLADIQESGYSKRVRDVPESLKKTICERDGVKWEDHDKYEVDHLIPLALGGSNSTSNLWCQPKFGQHNALQKDAVERRVLKMVRDEEMDLREAQTKFGKDWISLGNEVFGVRAFGRSEIPEETIDDSEQ